MRVSKRVSCEEWRQGCPRFVEKRWVRCERESFAFALWFAIVESASLDPQCRSPALQALMNERLNPTEQKVLLALLQRKGLSDDEKLSVWNCEQGVDLMRRMMMVAYECEHLGQLGYCSQQVTALCQRCNVNILHNPQSGSVPFQEDQTQIFIDTLTAEEYIILYSDYAYSSFLVTRCGDVLYKYALFRRMAEYCRSQALSKTEFIQFKYMCGHQIDITDTVFDCAASDGEQIDGATTIRKVLEDTPTPESPNSGSKCVVCHFIRDDLKFHCAKRCRVCTACTVRNYCSERFAFCPCCDSPLSQMSLDEVSKYPEIGILFPSLPARITTGKYLHCVKCKQEKGSGCAILYNMKVHNCVVCDECWLLSSGKCNFCNMELSGHFVAEIERLKQERQWEMTIKSMKLSGLCIRSICGCPESTQRVPCKHLEVNKIAWSLGESVMCTDCMLQEPFVNPCQTCRCYARFNCTSCNEVISLDHKNEEVEGLCERGGCILCLVCLKHGFFRGWRCLICKVPCKIRDPENIKEKRERLELRCCTQSKMKKLVRCGCKQIVHKKCKLCMICKTAQNPQSTNKL